MLRQRRPGISSTGRAGRCPPVREWRPELRTPAQRRSGLSSRKAETGCSFSLRKTGLGARQLTSDAIAIYVKALRRSLDAAAKRLPLHAAVAFVAGVRLTFGRLGVHDRSKEITAMPELLDPGKKTRTDA